MFSHVSYRIENKITIDGGRQMDLGRPWYKKIDGPKPATP
jgi:hypothetical protein